MVHCRRTPIFTAVVAVAACSLLAAGCGGAELAGSCECRLVHACGHDDDHAERTGRVLPCMRSNGMPTFPDPQRFVGGNVKLTIHQLVANNPRFQAALSACDHLLPSRGSGSQETAQQQRTQLADELSFARCMRSHGVSRFPDPTAQGGLSVEMVQAQGIDVHSPAVLHVVQACLPASHGALTPAKVREALNNAHG